MSLRGVHCSCVLTRLTSGDNLPGRVPHYSPEVENKFVTIGGAFRWTSNVGQVLSRNQFMHLSLDENHVPWSKGRRYVDQVLRDYDSTLQQLFAQQGNVRLKLPGMTLLVANALMLTAPLEALAETCEANKSDYNMPLFLFVSLIGATVGGLLARQRRGESERLNEQLRQINAALRRQAKIESYAPSLSYAPVGGKIPEEVIVDPKKHALLSHLKAGKGFLRNQNPDKVFVEFKAALELAQSIKDPTSEKKAARGLGASMQRQRKYKEAIKYHSMVLVASAREGETSGNTEAYGAIADCYTELGDLDQAGKFYDEYITRLETD